MSDALHAQLQASLGGAYTIDRELGGGGMSRVFVATDVTLDRQIVVKTLPSDAVPAASLERFHREIRTAAKLQHPHIVPVLSAGETGGVPFYTMPFVPGESLRHRLSKGGELSVNEAIHVLRDIASALAYAHREGDVHRDIKPENVMLSGGVAVVTDFGVAKAVDASVTDGGHATTGLTSLGVALGTPAYMSPEQATADPHVDHRSDIYSFGCVAYEMLAGVGPYSGRSAQQLLAAHVQEVPESLLKRRPNVPPALAALVMRCLEKRPGDRPQAAEELIVALDAIATPSGGTQPTSARLAATRPARRVTLARAAIAVAVLVVAVGTVVSLARRAPSTVRPGVASAIANSAELEMEPAISPDGKFVAYSAGVPGGQRIFVKQIAGGRATLVTGELDGSHQFPNWSPDGSQILFEARNAVYVVPAFGGTARRLFAPEHGVAANPVWSPDGRKIAYADEQGIWIRAADGGSPTLRLEGGAYHSLAWSRDGRLLAFVEGNRASLQNVSVGTIWTMPAEKGEGHRVSPPANVNTSPAFLPGGELLYVSNRDGAPDLFQQPLHSDGRANGDPVRLTTGLFARTISVAADGSRMVYDIVRNRSKIWSLAIPASGAASMAGATRITDENERIEGMRLSHDGAWLAYDSDRNGNSDIYKLKLDGGLPIQLTNNPANEFSPSWSPDDREIAFHSSRNGDRDIFITTAEGGAEQRVTSGPRQDYWPDWSPDGRRLAFWARSGVEQYRVWVVDRQGTGKWSEPRSTSSLSFSSCAHWSPDGTSILAFSQDRLVTLSPEGGEPVVAWTAGTTGEVLRSCAWGRDASTLYFNTQSPDGRFSFWSVPVKGGPRRQLLRDDPSHRLGRWDFDTDGKRLFFTLAADESDVWVVELKK